METTLWCQSFCNAKAFYLKKDFKVFKVSRHFLSFQHSQDLEENSLILIFLNNYAIHSTLLRGLDKTLSHARVKSVIELLATRM